MSDLKRLKDIVDALASTLDVNTRTKLTDEASAILEGAGCLVPINAPMQPGNCVCDYQRCVVCHPENYGGAPSDELSAGPQMVQAVRLTAKLLQMCSKLHYDEHHIIAMLIANMPDVPLLELVETLENRILARYGDGK